jgi:tRNA-dihydrouridine synthase B
MWTGPPTQLQIDGIAIQPPLVLAPIAGYTTSPFRRVCRRHGAGMVTSELLSAYGLFYGDRKTQAMLAFHEEERPIAVQIFGAEPDICARAAAVVEQAGADLIDLNMGCSVRKVAMTGAGAALLKDPDRAARVARAVVAAVGIPVTAKLRIGWRRQGPDAVEVGRRLEDVGVKALALHARYARWTYETPADWTWIARLKESVSVPVIGNGDVTSLANARRMLDETGCDGVMIGRAALANPAVFEGGGETARARIDLAEEHIRLLAESPDPRQAARGLRSHLLRYLRSFEGARRLRASVTRIESPEDALAVLDAARSLLPDP